MFSMLGYEFELDICGVMVTRHPSDINVQYSLRIYRNKILNVILTYVLYHLRCNIFHLGTQVGSH